MPLFIGCRITSLLLVLVPLVFEQVLQLLHPPIKQSTGPDTSVLKILTNHALQLVRSSMATFKLFVSFATFHEVSLELPSAFVPVSSSKLLLLKRYCFISEHMTKLLNQTYLTSTPTTARMIPTKPSKPIITVFFFC